MANQIITQGYVEANMIITQGYSIRIPVPAAKPEGSASKQKVVPQAPKPKPRVPLNVLSALLSYLTFKVTS